ALIGLLGGYRVVLVAGRQAKRDGPEGEGVVGRLVLARAELVAVVAKRSTEVVEHRPRFVAGRAAQPGPASKGRDAEGRDARHHQADRPDRQQKPTTNRLHL